VTLGWEAIQWNFKPSATYKRIEWRRLQPTRSSRPNSRGALAFCSSTRCDLTEIFFIRFNDLIDLLDRKKKLSVKSQRVKEHAVLATVASKRRWFFSFT
jgi:hypothetical protein